MFPYARLKIPKAHLLYWFFTWFHTSHLHIKVRISLHQISPILFVAILVLHCRPPLLLGFSCQSCRVLTGHSYSALPTWSLLSPVPVNHLLAPVREFQSLLGRFFHVLPESNQDHELVPIAELKEMVCINRLSLVLLKLFFMCQLRWTRGFGGAWRSALGGGATSTSARSRGWPAGMPRPRGCCQWGRSSSWALRALKWLEHEVGLAIDGTLTLLCLMVCY